MDIAKRLSDISKKEKEKLQVFLGGLEPQLQSVLLIEACRVFDYWHVQEAFSKNLEKRLQPQVFTIMTKGWNILLSQLLPNLYPGPGIPLRASTSKSISDMTSLLYQLGSAALLEESVAQLQHGMLQASDIDENTISLRMSERCRIDHFLDRLETEKIKKIEEREFNSTEHLNDWRVDNLTERLKSLIFPYETSQGTMIGYGAEPDIDNHFLSLVLEQTLDWRNEAGIHPDITVCNTSGADIISIGCLLISIYLKHINFVNVGKVKIPSANYFMSMTIWKPKAELIDSIAEFSGIDKSRVASAIDLFVVNSSRSDYFAQEHTPYVPMLIEVTDDYLLSPVSSIFRNPFTGVRMICDGKNEDSTAIRHPRENWMISDLYHLFLGGRYIVLRKPIKLKKDGKILTDIDAAIYDTISGELALFQLKWQDFSSNDVRKQRSRAKNFVCEVDEWCQKVSNWIEESGKGRLFQSIQMRVDRPLEDITIKMFAIGRSAARFQSYGYTTKHAEIAVSVWQQFIRLRYEIGPVHNVLGHLHSRIIEESERLIKVSPMPYELKIADYKIIYEDLWYEYDDE